MKRSTDSPHDQARARNHLNQRSLRSLPKKVNEKSEAAQAAVGIRRGSQKAAGGSRWRQQPAGSSEQLAAPAARSRQQVAGSRSQAAGSRSSFRLRPSRPSEFENANPMDARLRIFAGCFGCSFCSFLLFRCAPGPGSAGLPAYSSFLAPLFFQPVSRRTKKPVLRRRAKQGG